MNKLEVVSKSQFQVLESKSTAGRLESEQALNVVLVLLNVETEDLFELGSEGMEVRGFEDRLRMFGV